jgi:hypothetical protein
MAIERIDLAWEDVTEEDGTQLRRPKLPALPDGYYCARSGFEDHPPTQHPADDEHPEPWIEPDPRPAQAWYDYQPIPTPPAITMADRHAEQTQRLDEGRAHLGEAADQDDDTTSLAAYCKAVRGALAGVTDPAKVAWPAKPWGPTPTP